MATLFAGLLLFLGVHLIPAVPGLRSRLASSLGEQRYKGWFSIASGLGLALIIVGYMISDDRARVFGPWPEARGLAPYAMTLSFILLAASNMRSYLRRWLAHPMLLGIIIWSLVHLLANGDRRGTVLFGAFLLWALFDLVAASLRPTTKTFVPEGKFDLMAIVGGALLALLVMTFHRLLFGPMVVSFGI